MCETMGMYMAMYGENTETNIKSLVAKKLIILLSSKDYDASMKQ